MEKGKKENVWERTNVTNLLRNRESGTYYARVKIGNKQKWRTLKTNLFSVAKLRLGDVEKDIRSRGAPAIDTDLAGGGDLTISRYLSILRLRIERDTELAPATKIRREVAIKTLTRIWPDLPARDIRRVTANECQEWAIRIRQKGTGSERTKRNGLSASGWNKLVDELRAIFEIAVSQGVIYRNPAANIPKIPQKQKRLKLPSASQFDAIVAHIAGNGTRWAACCAELVQLLAYSGARIEEARMLRWSHVDFTKNELAVPGTKSATSDRIVPLFPALAEHLEAMKLRRVSPAPEEAILQVESSLASLATACAAVGVAKLTHHDLRHFFATKCIESGVDVPTVSRWLGHSDGGALAMRTYGHLRQEHSQAQAAKVKFGR